MDEQLKVKRKALSLAEKLDVLGKFDARNVINKTAFAKSVGIHESTLRALLKNRQKLLNSASAGGYGRKKIKVGKFVELEKVLFEWFTQTLSMNIPTNGPLIKEKACEIATRLGVDFTPSNGWLDRFRQRYGIVYRQVCGEFTAVNVDDVNCWKYNVLALLLTKYSSSDIYNVDEMGLFFKLMPDKTMALKGEKCSGGKLSNERITVLVGSNMDGTDKLKPLVIGKSQNPRCFKNARNLPCDYESQCKAWMTGDLFVKWIRKFDERMKKESRKVLCLVDNCPAHPKDIPGLQNIELVFLPPNSNSVVQPMDQGIVHVLKVKYKRRVVIRHLHQIDHLEKDLSCPTCKPINLLDAMHFLSASWEDVTPTTITNCFCTAFDVDGTSQDCDIAEEEQKQEECKDWDSFVSVDDQVVTCEVRSIGEIIEDVKSSDETRPSGDEDDDPGEETDAPAVPSFTSVMSAFSSLRQYASSLDAGPSTEDFLHHINRAENFVIKSRPTWRQTKARDFFTTKVAFQTKL